MTRFDSDNPTARVSAHEVEVPGAPEDVWQAIATGPGIATWFVPAEVEEREGGRIVTDHGPYGRSEGDGWEKHLEGTDEGWVAGLRNLRLSLTHFPGQAAAAMMVFGTVAERHPDHVGRELLEALGLDKAVMAAPIHLSGPAPNTRGTVVDVDRRSVTLRLDEPHPGILEIATFDHGGATVAVRGYLYGPGGDRIAAQEAPRWTAWLTEHVEGLVPLT